MDFSGSNVRPGRFLESFYSKWNSRMGVTTAISGLAIVATSMVPSYSGLVIFGVDSSFACGEMRP